MRTSKSELLRVVTGAGRAILLTGLLLVPQLAGAFPSFARQTGQTCIACHAGEQYSELTPLGHMYQSTGYALGTRTLPAGMSRLRSSISADLSGDFPRDAVALFQAGSPVSGRWLGSSGWAIGDGDLPRAGHSARPVRDLFIGYGLGRAPSLTGPWNVAPEWIDFDPARFGLFGAVPAQLRQQASGVSAYALWNNTLYAEIASYRSANASLSMPSRGLRDTAQPRLKAWNPYARLALNYGWGPHNTTLAVLGMNLVVDADKLNPGGPATRYRDRAIDAQYQYLLGPHTLTAQLNFTHESIDGGDLSGAGNPSNTLSQFRLKGSYVYRAKFGASLGVLDISGWSDGTLDAGGQLIGMSGTSAGTSAGTSSGPSAVASGPAPLGASLVNGTAARIWMPELYWMPVDYLRIGAQYLSFRHLGGAARSYDSAGRDASSTLLIYAWGAY